MNVITIALNRPTKCMDASTCARWRLGPARRPQRKQQKAPAGGSHSYNSKQAVKNIHCATQKLNPRWQAVQLDITRSQHTASLTTRHHYHHNLLLLLLVPQTSTLTCCQQLLMLLRRRQEGSKASTSAGCCCCCCQPHRPQAVQLTRSLVLLQCLHALTLR